MSGYSVLEPDFNRQQFVSESPMVRATQVSLCGLALVLPIEGVLPLSGVGTLTRSLGAVALGLGLLSIAFSGRVRRPPREAIIGFCIAGFAGASTLWSLDPEASLVQMATYLQNALLIWLLANFVSDPRQRSRILVSFIAGSSASAAMILAGFLRDDSLVRYQADGINPNAAGLVFIIAVVFAAAVHQMYGIGRYTRASFVLALPVLLFATVLTGSRSALVALAILALSGLVPLLRSSSTLSRLGILGMLGVLGSLVRFVPDALWSRQVEIVDYVRGADVGMRRQLVDLGQAIFADSPIVGVGAGASRVLVGAETGEVAGLHNTYVSVLAEGGVLYGLLWMALFGTILVRVTRSSNRYRSTWQILWAVLAVSLLSRHWEYNKLLWLVIGLTAISNPLPNRVRTAGRSFSLLAPERVMKSVGCDRVH